MLVSQKAMLVAKLESTPYTAETLTNTEFDIEVENLSWGENITMFQRKVMDGTLDSYNSVPGQQTGSFKFMVPINPGATATTEPAWSKFLQGCGFFFCFFDKRGNLSKFCLHSRVYDNGFCGSTCDRGSLVEHAGAVCQRCFFFDWSNLFFYGYRFAR